MSRFVPRGCFDLSLLARLRAMMRGKRVGVLTGAGCSTASGIPDYRGPVTGKKERSPIMYQEFVTSAEARRRYWARSALGWPRLRSARPNPAHFALAELEEGGLLTGLITQNVDGLHGAAGSQQLVELHGALARVRCLDCGAHISRDAVQEWLLSHNPGWRSACDSAEMAPDGDMEIPEIPATFRVPTCSACRGSLNPDVVFFGENVATDVVNQAWRVVDEAGLLLVVGSSLTVYSGFRFVLRAKERAIPVALVNIGPTRADDVADLKIEAPCCEVLTRLS